MKKVVLTIAATCVAISLQAQGTVYFCNHGGGYRFPIYGPETPDFSVAKTGNTTAGLPPGTQVYTGALLAGSRYSAQLLAAPGINVPVSLLVAAPTIATFRTGNAAGFVPFLTVALPGVPADAPFATIVMVVWDNQGGLFPDVFSLSHGGTFAAMSKPITVGPLGGGINPPASLLGMESFNIYRLVPEPTTMALAGLGTVLWLISRRRR